MADRMHIDVKCLDDLKIQLEQASEDVRRKVDIATLRVGAELAEMSKVKASGHSKSIPPTIKMVPAPEGGAVAIEAGRPGEPLARLYEKGNKGPRGQFKHPVFGNKAVWVAQKRFPFIKPTFNANRSHFAEVMKAAGEEGLDPLRKGGGPE